MKKAAQDTTRLMVVPSLEVEVIEGKSATKPSSLDQVLKRVIL